MSLGCRKTSTESAIEGNNSVNAPSRLRPTAFRRALAPRLTCSRFMRSRPNCRSRRRPPRRNRDVLLAAMKDRMLASAELKVVYTRPDGGDEAAPARRRPAGSAGRETETMTRLALLLFLTSGLVRLVAAPRKQAAEFRGDYGRGPRMAEYLGDDGRPLAGFEEHDFQDAGDRAFGAEGMRFAYGYALSPRCTPSRAALFTGIGPAALHMTYVGIGRSSGPVHTRLIPPEPILELPKDVTTVAETLEMRRLYDGAFRQMARRALGPGAAWVRRQRRRRRATAGPTTWRVRIPSRR